MDQSSAVLITGGGGFLGSRILQSFSKSERPILCLYRHSKPEEVENIYPVCNDLSSSELLAVPLRGVSTVIHLAWEGSYSEEGLCERKIRNFKSKNLENLSNLLIACQKADVEKIVFLSIKGASSTSLNLFALEKYFAEVLVLNSMIKEKIVLRSDIIYAKGQNLFINSISSLFALPMVIPVPGRRSKYSPVHVDDVVKVIKRILDSGLGNETAVVRHISSNEKIDSKMLVSIAADSQGLKNRIFLNEPFAKVLNPFLDSRRKQDAVSMEVFDKIGRQKELSEPINQSDFKDFKDGILV